VEHPRAQLRRRYPRSLAVARAPTAGERNEQQKQRQKESEVKRRVCVAATRSARVNISSIFFYFFRSRARKRVQQKAQQEEVLLFKEKKIKVCEKLECLTSTLLCEMITNCWVLFWVLWAPLWDKTKFRHSFVRSYFARAIGLFLLFDLITTH